MLIPVVGGPRHGEFVEKDLVVSVHEFLHEGQVVTYRLEPSEDGLVYRYKEEE